MSSLSTSSVNLSTNEDPAEHQEEKILALYRGIKQNLQEIQSLATDMNVNLKNIETQMSTTVFLLNILDSPAAAQKK